MPAKTVSDLHLRVNMPPIYRIHGKLVPAVREFLSKDDMEGLIHRLLTERQRQRFDETWELDLGLNIPTGERFRVNIYRERGNPGIAFRLINNEVPDFNELNLPKILKKLSTMPRGLILVTGVTGSGKSTSLASMIDYVNRNKGVNILTIEDPIEFVHTNRRSIIAQREIGSDCSDYAMGLRQALRQDPDVILVGEIRDADTMSIALSAADTGHLVLSTLHTLDSLQTIYRILSFFPPHQHQEIRHLLSSTLQSVISQRLVPRHDKPGRVPAVEILIGTGAVRECIVDPSKTVSIRDLISEGASQYGMQSYDQSLMWFYQNGAISLETAMENSSNPDDFRLRVDGVLSGSDRGWAEFASTQSTMDIAGEGENDNNSEGKPPDA
ncbi:MAG TPA: PilT/PilU family type 4a pilus ATPase [candidate division Zixibacteria bacterium]|nr:PilT/PilU family type 4a pilus ATPase [candidate division Zixibacteria bacterium]